MTAPDPSSHEHSQDSHGPDGSSGAERGPRDTSHPRNEPIEAQLLDDNDAATATGLADSDAEDEVVHAQLADARSTYDEEPPLRPRRKKLPLILFTLTCFSTFWVGATQWSPQDVIVQGLNRDPLNGAYVVAGFMPLRQTLYEHWDEGLIYMFCLVGILLTHEMGHFIATLRHRIPASFPYFIPLPINAIGTLGAVIGMDGRRADRKEIFDIGVAGPIAGLVVAVPVLVIGIYNLDFTQPEAGQLAFENPLAVRFLLDLLQPPGYQAGDKVWISQLNPYYMAGWVGLLITGLNMLPVSQLDGGHVVYTLFGRKWAHWIARGFMIVAIAYIVYDLSTGYIWIIMVIFVLLMGTDHPPTRDDSVKIGWLRTTIGLASLLIPILCFPPRGLTIVTEF